MSAETARNAWISLLTLLMSASSSAIAVVAWMSSAARVTSVAWTVIAVASTFLCGWHFAYTSRRTPKRLSSPTR